MTLKNKIIFGTTGFLVASGVIALTIVLATSGEESQSKAKSKTKIDVPKLSSNSFGVTGTQTQGKINLKSDVILAKEVELKYFVGPDAPTNDNTYTTNKPATLKNGDIVYVKPFIKKASISSYAFKAKANPIKFVVSGLPLTAISSSLLTKDSFVISGVQTQGMIKKKVGVTLPSEVEARYFKGASAPKLDESYKLSILSDLSNGDKVHIKFFIKNEYITTHKLANDFTNLLTLPIDTLPKIEINRSLLVRDSFLISGSESQGTIKKKARATLPTEVEIKYFKGSNAPSQDSAYESRVPTNLSNGDNVHIKFFIKSEYIATHKFASDFLNLISISVEGLKTLIDDRTLQTSSFEFRNAPSKTIRWKSRATLPEQLVIKYYKSLSNIRPSSDNDYKTNVPTNLSEGDHIYIKFFIKEEHKNKYKFANGFENFIHLEVKNNSFKSIINILNLKTSSFQTSGNNGTGIIQWNDKISLPNEVEIKYAKIASEPSHNNQYNPLAPTNLSNGDIIYIKFFIKNGFSTSHEFPTSDFENPVKFVIKSLKTLIDHRTLKKSSFAVTGTQGKGTIGWKANSRAPILPSQVEIRYYKGSFKPSGDNSYKTIPSLALSNNDLVHIKFFIKEEHTKTYEFASDFSNYILFAINNLDRNEVDDASLVSNSFQATGVQGTGTMKLKDDVTLPSEVEAKYYKGTNSPGNEGDYQTSFPSMLSNGDKVHIKFFIKSGFDATHKLPSSGFENPIQFVVRGLDRNEVDIASLTSSSFEVTGGQGTGTMKLKDDVTLPREVEAKYYKGTNSPVNEGDYQTISPLNLINGDKVYIKFFIKSRFDATHKLPLGDFENPLQFVVRGLDKNEVDATKLVNSSFEVIGTQGNGTMKLKDEITLPSEVEAKYYKGTNSPGNEGDYQTIFPSMLSNGDKIYIKFFIKSGFALTHKLPSSGFENPIQFVVRGLDKNEVDIASLTSSSFEVIGTQGNGTMKLKDEITLPSAVEAKYYKGTNSPVNEGDYQTISPLNLINGDKVYIKFFIKSRFDATHKLPSSGFENPLQFVVRGLDKNEVDATKLVNSSFEVIGTQGNGTMKLKDEITLPSAVEAKYYKGTNSPSNEGDYQTISPLNLINGDKVYIKFFIKSRFDATHKLPTSGFENPVQFIVRGLDKNEVDATKLVNSSFEVIGTQGNGTMKLKDDVTLPSAVEAKYYKGTNSPSNEGDYQTIPPLNLINGDKVYIKFFIKSRFDATHKLPSSGFENPLQFVVRGLDKNEVDTANLASSSFEVIGTQGNGTMGLKDGVILPSEIEAKYYKGTIQPINEGDYQNSFPLMLSNGDKVYIKFFIKSEFTSTHIFPTSFNNPAPFIVNGLITNKNSRALQDSSGNIWAMENGTPLQVFVKNRDGNYANARISDHTQEGLLKGSNIFDGNGGVVFEDSRGNIWAMGYGSSLQVLVKNRDGNYANAWISDHTQEGLLKGSKITNGYGGVIFEDSSGNIWAMGNETPLQVLVKNRDGNYANAWISDHTQEGLLKGSKIFDGHYGVIFEDSSGNIWAIGYGSSLQVLVKNRDGNYANAWISDHTQEGLLNGSNIFDGYGGVVFEDSRGNIWAMGYGSSLQVLVKNRDGNYANAWISDHTQEGLLKDSKILDGYYGVIFEDSRGNIWAMGSGTPLQVLVKKEDGSYANAWISDHTQEGLLKGSNITNGDVGVIFEDSRGNIWAMGNGTPLQVLVKNRDGSYANAWISDHTQEGLLKGSNITDGYFGVIFEDSYGNIWAMGNRTPLQVLKKQGNGFAASWTSP